MLGAPQHLTGRMLQFCISKQRKYFDYGLLNIPPQSTLGDNITNGKAHSPKINGFDRKCTWKYKTYED